MATHTCDTDDCDTEIVGKNAAGHYRSKCPECIKAVAAERDLSNNPFHHLAEKERRDGTL